MHILKSAGNVADDGDGVSNLQYNFEVPPARPSATAPVDDVLAWAVWSALEIGLRDVVFEESDDGLLVGCLDYTRRGRNHGPKYYALATLPHLRGSPLKQLPDKAMGVVAAGREKWSVRLWICQKLVGEMSRLCAVVQLVPYASA